MYQYFKWLYRCSLYLCVLSNEILASGSGDKTIKLWNTSNFTLLKTLNGHSKHVWSLVLLPNGYLASCSEDKTIKIWNLEISDDNNSEQCQNTFNAETEYLFSLAVWNGHLISQYKESEECSIKIWNLNYV